MAWCATPRSIPIQLADTKIHPALNILGQRTLLDCLGTEEDLRRWYDSVSTYWNSRFKAKVRQLEREFHRDITHNAAIKTAQSLSRSLCDTDYTAIVSEAQDALQEMHNVMEEANVASGAARSSVEQLKQQSPIDASALEQILSHMARQESTWQGRFTALSQRVIHYKEGMSRLIAMMLQTEENPFFVPHSYAHRIRSVLAKMDLFLKDKIRYIIFPHRLHSVYLLTLQEIALRRRYRSSVQERIREKLKQEMETERKRRALFADQVEEFQKLLHTSIVANGALAEPMPQFDIVVSNTSEIRRYIKRVTDASMQSPMDVDTLLPDIAMEDIPVRLEPDPWSMFSSDHDTMPFAKGQFRGESPPKGVGHNLSEDLGDQLIEHFQSSMFSSCGPAVDAIDNRAVGDLVEEQEMQATLIDQGESSRELLGLFETEKSLREQLDMARSKDKEMQHHLSQEREQNERITQQLRLLSIEHDDMKNRLRQLNFISATTSELAIALQMLEWERERTRKAEEDWSRQMVFLKREHDERLAELEALLQRERQSREDAERELAKLVREKQLYNRPQTELDHEIQRRKELELTQRTMEMEMDALRCELRKLSFSAVRPVPSTTNAASCDAGPPDVASELQKVSESVEHQ